MVVPRVKLCVVRMRNAILRTGLTVFIQTKISVKGENKSVPPPQIVILVLLDVL